MNPTNCRHCGRITPGHFCRTVAPGESKTCIAIAKARNVRASNARVRQQGAAVSDYEPLTVRSRSTVAKMLGLTVSAVRLIELRALKKARRLLMPFRGATSGEFKIKQVTQPLPSLAD